jgi:hypothetical protein
MALGALEKWIGTAVDFAKDAALKGLASSLPGASLGSSSTDPNLKNRNYAVIIKQDQEIPQAGPPIIIVGAVPPSFQIAQNVEWKAPWGAGLAGDGMISDIMAVTGNRLVAQVMTMQVWQGSGNDFEFSVQFELRAWSDPKLDVLDPIKALLRMSLPGIDPSGFLKSPGPILTKDGVEKISGLVTKTVVDAGAAAASAYTNRTQDGGSNYLGGIVDGVTGAFNSVSGSGIARKSTIEQYLKNKISIQIGRWFSLDNVVITQVQHEIKTQTPERETGLVQSATVTVGFKPMFSITAEDIDTMLRVGGSTR